MENINEVTLNRLFHHIQKENITSWAILTSFRDIESPSENNKKFKTLKTIVRTLNLGYIELVGHGQEEGEEGGIKQVKEKSLFIPKINQKQAQKLSTKFNQWGFIYSGPEIKDKIALISIEGIEYLNSFHPMKIANFYSKIKGRPFTFESISPISNTERFWKYLKNV